MTALTARTAPVPSPPRPKLRRFQGQHVDSDGLTTVRQGIPKASKSHCSVSSSIAQAAGGVRSPSPTGLPGPLDAMPRQGDMKRRGAPGSPLTKLLLACSQHALGVIVDLPVTPPLPTAPSGRARACVSRPPRGPSFPAPSPGSAHLDPATSRRRFYHDSVVKTKRSLNPFGLSVVGVLLDRS